MVKNLPTNAGDVRDVGRSPEEDMGTHSGILAWRIATDRGGWLGMVHRMEET